MSDSLRALYTPPRVLELPPQAPSATGDLVTIGLSLLRAGAIYAPDPPVFRAGEKGAPFCDGMAPNSASSPAAGEGYDSPAPSGESVADQARSAVAGYYARHGGGAGSEDGGATADGAELAAAAQQQQQQQQRQQQQGQEGGRAEAAADDAAIGGGGEETKPDREKVLRARVAACLSALKSAREEQEAFSEELQQAHIQVCVWVGGWVGGCRPISYFIMHIQTTHPKTHRATCTLARGPMNAENLVGP